MSRLDTVTVGDKLPDRVYEPDNVQLFFYNAILWNAHRIHYDLPYATEVEGYPGLVIAGPMMGDWLAQAALEWMGEDGTLVSVSYSNRNFAIIGEVLHLAGEVGAVDKKTGDVTLDLAILNAEDVVLTPGSAVVRLPAGG